MFTKIARLSAMALVCAAVASPAFAVELVTNGGFESFTPINIGPTPPGTFNSPDGWDTNLPGGGAQFSGVNQGTFFQNPAVVHAGSNAFDFGTLACCGVISQTLITIPGTQYAFEFWLANDTSEDVALDSFTAVWSGATDVTVLDISNDQGRAYERHRLVLTADSDQTDIVFTAFNDTLWWHLDDVSVTPVAASVAEPASLLLLTLGGAGLAAFRKHRAA
jgi:PEP-CTERM motif